MSKKPADQATPATTAKVQRRSAVKPGNAKDGSMVLRLAQPAGGTKAAQWLVESTVKLGHTTLLHQHHKSEEICHVIAGSERVTLGDEWFQVRTEGHHPDSTRNASPDPGDREHPAADADDQLSSLLR